MAQAKEVRGPGPRMGGPRPKVENPGKLLKRIMDEVFRHYLPHCILVLVCIVVSALANVQASLFLKTLMLTHREGEIAAIKSRLLDGGALGAVMSGTGSAVFGIFADADSAAYAKRRLARDYAECFLTETIGRLEI